MLLAASGTLFNVHDQLQAVRMQLAGRRKQQTAKLVSTASVFQTAPHIPASTDYVSLAFNNGVPIQAWCSGSIVTFTD